MSNLYRIANLTTGAVYTIEASSPRVALGRAFQLPAEQRAISPGRGAEVVFSYAIKNEGPAGYAYRVQATDDATRARAQSWSVNRQIRPSDYFLYEVQRDDTIADQQGYTTYGTTREGATREAQRQIIKKFAADPEAAAAVKAWRAGSA